MILDETGHESGEPRGAETAREPAETTGSERKADRTAGPEIDPNYDPAFQRGYQPTAGDQVPIRAREAVSPVDPSPFLRPVEEDTAAVIPVAAAGELPVDAEPDTTQATPATGNILDRVEISPRRNPYVLALWILGGGFVVLGIVLYALSVYTSYTTSSTASDVTALVFSQIGWMLAGPLVTVGLATIVSLVLLSALRSRGAETAGADAGADAGAHAQ